MRISLAAIGDVTAASCLKYQCGADPQNIAARIDCANAGYSGVHSCAEPQCAPYCPNKVPAVVAAVTQNAVHANIPPTITPANIVPRSPDLTAALEPTAPPARVCSGFAALNQSIADNPAMAVAILLVAGFVFWKL